MNLDDYVNSGFWKKEDCAQPRRMIIEEFGVQEYDDEKRPKIKFQGDERWLVLNQTNIQFLTHHFGTSDARSLVGCHVVMYNDMGVTFRGRRGGIRLRAPDPSPVEATPNEQYQHRVETMREPGDEF